MENNNKKLVMGHVVLYAKGWYKRSKEVWKDYRRAIIADGRYNPYTRHDVAQLLLQFVLENAKRLNKGHLSDPCYISEEIRKNIGYLYYWRDNDTENLKKRRGMNLENLSGEDMYDNAVIMTCHYIMEFSDPKDFDKILAPSSKVLPLKHSEPDYKNELFEGKNWYDDEDADKTWFYENFVKYHTDDFTITELEYYDENKEVA
jgi:hypothetical protein